MMVQVPIFPPLPDKVQIFHNTQARFKFPTHQVNACGSPWGGVGENVEDLNWLAHKPTTICMMPKQ